MSIQLYRKIEGQLDTTYVLVSDVDDKTESDKGVVGNTTYRYKLVRSSGVIQYAVATTLAEEETGINSITDFTATAQSASQIGLTWDYTPVTGFPYTFPYNLEAPLFLEIYRKLDSEGEDAYALIATVDITTQTYTDTGLTPATTYDYKGVVVQEGQADTGPYFATATTFAEMPGNVPPVANAGTDNIITLPTSSVVLQGSGTDSDGTIASYAWTKVSGTGGTITTPNAATTTVTGLTQGTYVFRLTVTDNQGATHSDDVTITVNTQPAAAGTIAMDDDLNIYTYTPPTGESTNPSDYEAEITLT